MAELFTARCFSYGSNLYSGGSCLICNKVDGSSRSSVSNFKIHPRAISMPLKFRIKGGTACCNANSNNRRRNQDFSRNGRQGFSHGRIQQTEERERDSFDNFDESDMLFSNNGPLLSGNQKQPVVTSLPGPKEKEIVELFRKVQAQLRERAAMKEEKKLESTRGQGKENETVDSLLKLLRKHSTEQSRRNGGPSEEKGYSIPPVEEKPRSFFDDNNSTLPREQPIASFTRRPPSKFRRVSPVPQVKYRPINIATERDDVNSSIKADINGISVDKVEEVQELNYEPFSDPETEIEPAETVVPDAADYEVLEAELSESDVADDETDNVEEAEDEIDLTALKLVELREIAKSRGLKGFSKMKKSDLLELLKEN